MSLWSRACSRWFRGALTTTAPHFSIGSSHQPPLPSPGSESVTSWLSSLSHGTWLRKDPGLLISWEPMGTLFQPVVKWQLGHLVIGWEGGWTKRTSSLASVSMSGKGAYKERWWCMLHQFDSLPSHPGKGCLGGTGLGRNTLSYWVFSWRSPVPSPILHWVFCKNQVNVCKNLAVKIFTDFILLSWNFIFFSFITETQVLQATLPWPSFQNLEL